MTSTRYPWALAAVLLHLHLVLRHKLKTWKLESRDFIEIAIQSRVLWVNKTIRPARQILHFYTVQETLCHDLTHGTFHTLHCGCLSSCCQKHKPVKVCRPQPELRRRLHPNIPVCPRAFKLPTGGDSQPAKPCSLRWLAARQTLCLMAHNFILSLPPRCILSASKTSPFFGLITQLCLRVSCPPRKLYLFLRKWILSVCLCQMGSERGGGRELLMAEVSADREKWDVCKGQHSAADTETFILRARWMFISWALFACVRVHVVWLRILDLLSIIWLKICHSLTLRPG